MPATIEFLTLSQVEARLFYYGPIEQPSSAPQVEGYKLDLRFDGRELTTGLVVTTRLSEDPPCMCCS